MRDIQDLILNSSAAPMTPLIPHTAGFEQCLPGHCFGPYIREIYLLHYCVSGKGQFEIHNTIHQVRPGHLFIITPKVVTTYRADFQDPWHYVWIGFTGGSAERLLELPPVVPYEADTFLRIKETVKTHTLSPEIYASLIFELFHYLFSAKEPPADVCRQIRDYVVLNYMKPLTVEELSRQAGLNRRYLSRIFKEKYGVPLKEYIVAFRMRKACEMLQKGYSVSEAANMSGYTDVFHFSKMFHKTIGYSPAAYRKKCLSAGNDSHNGNASG